MSNLPPRTSVLPRITVPPRTVWSSHPPRMEDRKVARLIVIPVYNDWDVVALLMTRIDNALFSANLEADVLLVDDGSTLPPEQFTCPAVRTVGTVDILRMRRNLGHQRALAVGLAYAEQKIDPEIVIVMDGDGEDNPSDIPRMLEALDLTGKSKIVFAERRRRSEPALFQFFYQIYRALHLVLTGVRVRVGNYSVIPRVALARLVVISEMWNHYAAAVFNARLDYATVPTTRAPRLAGQSKMNFISLVVHGLSALSVYSHIIGVRLLVSMSALGVIAAGGLVAIVAGKVSGASLPLWLVYGTAGLIAVLLQVGTVAMLFVFLMLAGRQGSSFIPLRDYAYFVDRVTRARPS